MYWRGVAIRNPPSRAAPFRATGMLTRCTDRTSVSLLHQPKQERKAEGCDPRLGSVGYGGRHGRSGYRAGVGVGAAGT